MDVVAQQWIVFGAVVLALGVLAAFFLSAPAASSGSGSGRNIEDLTRRMKDCC